MTPWNVILSSEGIKGLLRADRVPTPIRPSDPLERTHGQIENWKGTRIMDFTELRRANKARQEEWPGGGKIDLPFRGLELAGETGELLNLIKKRVRLDLGIQGTKESPQALYYAIREEIGDVMACLDLVAMSMGLDKLRLYENGGDKDNSLTHRGNNLAASVGRVCEAIEKGDPIGVTCHLSAAALALSRISNAMGMLLGPAVADKFNAVTKKHGFKTRMGQ